MKTWKIVLLVLSLALSACQADVTLVPPLPLTDNPSLTAVPETWPTQGWRTAAPAEQGIDPARLESAIASARSRSLGLESALVIRGGAIVSETYFGASTADTRHELYSCTKSFVSTLVGIAIDQGKLDGKGHTLKEYFPGPLAGNSDPRKDGITLEQVLTMTTGLDWVEGDPAYTALYRSQDWVKQVLSTPMRGQPGSAFNYCSGCSHLLSAIVQQAAGMNTKDFADQFLFQPLGIRNYRWDSDSRGIPIGGWGLQMTPRDMAKLGYLFLRQGRWEGKQIISAGWVEAATRKQVSSGGSLGYGYQWWIQPSPAGYSARGRYGQAIYVVPSLDLVVVTTATSNNEGAIYQWIEKEILPAVE